MPDPVVNWQIVADDPEQIATFYAKLFDWSIDRDNALGYRSLRTGSIDGGVWPTHAPGKATLQLFVEVADVDAQIVRATGLGATMMIPKTVLPDGDTIAILLDPAGLSFGIRQRRA